MTNQRIPSQRPKAAALPCIASIGLFVLFGNAHAAAQVTCFLELNAFAARQVLESVALAAASQTLQACIFNPQQLLQDLAHKLLALWSLLIAIASALLL